MEKRRRNLFNSIVSFMLLMAMIVTSSNGVTGSLATSEETPTEEKVMSTLEVKVLSEGGSVEICDSEWKDSNAQGSDVWVIDSKSESAVDSSSLDESYISSIKRWYEEGSSVNINVNCEEGYSIKKINYVKNGAKVDLDISSSLKLSGTSIITVLFKKDKINSSEDKTFSSNEKLDEKNSSKSSHNNVSMTQPTGSNSSELSSGQEDKATNKSDNTESNEDEDKVKKVGQAKSSLGITSEYLSENLNTHKAEQAEQLSAEYWEDEVPADTKDAIKGYAEDYLEKSSSQSKVSQNNESEKVDLDTLEVETTKSKYDKNGLRETTNYVKMHYTIANKKYLKVNTIDDLFKSNSNAFLTNIVSAARVYESKDLNDCYIAFLNYGDLNSLENRIIASDFVTNVQTNPKDVNSDIVFDENTGIVYIPKSYYFTAEGEEIGYDLQAQLLVSVTQEELESGVNVDVSVENKSSVNTELTSGVKKLSCFNNITFQLVSKKDADKVSFSDIDVYTNGSSVPTYLKKDVFASYNQETGEYTINQMGITTYSIKFVINRKDLVSRLKHMFGGQEVHAAGVNGTTMNFVVNESTGKPINPSIDVAKLSVGDVFNYKASNVAHKWGLRDSMIGHQGKYIYAPLLPNSGTDSIRDKFYYALSSDDGGNAKSLNKLINQVGSIVSITDQNPAAGSSGSVNPDKEKKYWYMFAIGAPHGTLESANGSKSVNFGTASEWNWSNTYTYNDATKYRHMYLGMCCHVGDNLVEGEDDDTTNQVSILEKGKDYLVLGLCQTGGGTSTSGQGGATIIKVQTGGAVGLKKVNGGKEICANNSNYSLAGAKYGVYRNSDGFVCSDLVGTLTTDSNGNTSELTVSPGKYYIQEITPPKYFWKDPKIYTIDVSAGGAASVTSIEYPIADPLVVVANKKDYDTEAGAPLGEAEFKDAEFTVKYYTTMWDNISQVSGSPERVWVLKTDKNGRARLDDRFLTDKSDPLYKDPQSGIPCIPAGSITIEETKAPIGYKINTEVKFEKINPDFGGTLFEEWNQEPATDSTNIKEQVYRADLGLIKMYFPDEDRQEIYEPIQGAEFTVTSKTTGEVMCTLISDEHGIATTKTLPNRNPRGYLPFDTYIIKETKTPEGFKPIDPFEVVLHKDGEESVYWYVVDQPIEPPVKIVKKDSESGKVIPMPGTTFKILDKNMEYISFTLRYPTNTHLTEFVTDGSGAVQLPERLKYGNYYLEETKAPEGYLKGNIIPFTADNHHDWGEPLVIEYSDEPVKGKIRIQKHDYDIDDKLVEGATYNIYAAEDIVTPDNTKHADRDELVDTVTTDSSGSATSKELYLGKYYVVESKTPNGYALNTNRYYCELKYKDQNTPIVYADVKTQDRPTELKLHKYDIDGLDLEGVNYHVECTSGTGEDFDLVTGKDGLVVKKYIKQGTYKVTETKTLPGYVLNKTPRYFKVNDKGYIFECDENGKAVKNKEPSYKTTINIENDYTKLDISKSDITGDNEVEGATLQIISKEDNQVKYEWVSTGEPHRIVKIPVGDYILRETLPASQYVKASDVEFTVKETGAVQKVQMKDKQLFVTKTDVTGEKELEGAKLTVKNEANEIVDQWVSGKEPHPVSNLEVNKDYVLIEEIAPEGYVIASEIKFHVEDDFKIQTVQMKDKQLFVTKTEITGDDELPGAKLKVLDKDGELMDEWVSGEEPHAVKNLRVNRDYTLIEETAPKGYVIATEIKFHVDDDFKVQTVQMKDKQVFVSKTDVTGDKEIEGAIMSVTDKKGETVDSWVSTDKPHAIDGLKVKNAYVLHEVVAPEGYVKASDIEFYVDDNFKIQTVHMLDEQVFVNKYAVIESDANTVQPNLVVDTVIDKEEDKGIDFGSDKEEPGIDFDSDKDESSKEEPGIDYEVDTSTPELSMQSLENDSSEDTDSEGSDLDDKGNGIIVDDDDNTLIEPIKPTPESVFDKLTGAVKEFFTGRKQLEGTKLQVIDNKGKVVDEWVQDDNSHAVSDLVAGNTYTLVEVEASKGYVVANPIKFTVVEDGENLTINMLDKQVLVSKVDITGDKEIPGAELVVKDKDGKEVDKWVSEKQPHPIEGLKVGETYTLTEYTAPEGYIKAETITFEVKDDFKIDHVKMFDDHTKLRVSKKDITNKKELPGAKLTIKDKNGKVVESWTSKKKPHYIEKLPVGKYTLTEDYAPLGYKKANSIKFEIKETGKVQKVTMFDKRASNYRKVQKLVQTGESDITYVGLAMLVMGIAMAALYSKKHRN